jgi:hypothetical protein
MGTKKVVAIAVSIAVAIASTGQLPLLMRVIYLSEAIVLRESRASNWGSPDLATPTANSLGEKRFTRKTQKTLHGSRQSN